MKAHKIASLLLLLFGACLGYKSYSGYQVLRTAPLNASQVLPTGALLRTFDLWSRPRVGRSVDVMVDPEQEPTLRKALQQLLGQEPSTLIPDLGLVVEREMEERIAAQHNDKNRAFPSFEKYLSIEDIDEYLADVVINFPQLASVERIGRSYRGRPLRVMKISNGGNKPAIFVESGMHAREWIGPPVVLYAIAQLTENYDQYKDLLDVVDFYFYVMANPDGYVYSWTEDRFWRKTRTPYEGFDCVGVDPNRNFDWHWNEDGNNDACSNTYPGVEVGCEMEVTSLQDFLQERTTITAYIAIHSYGQYILYPWGHSSELPPTVDELDRVGLQAADALSSVRGTQYTVGTTANALYLANGISQDWAYGVANIPLSYTLELPGGGSEGFDPPASDILPVVTETWEAIKVLAANIPAKRP